jgi:hypothetical protein
MASRLLPRYNIPQNNFNFNINMNFFLNNMNNYLNAPVHPYLNWEYQNYMFNQLRTQSNGITCNLNGLCNNFPV